MHNNQTAALGYRRKTMWLFREYIFFASFAFFAIYNVILVHFGEFGVE